MIKIKRGIYNKLLLILLMINSNSVSSSANKISCDSTFYADTVYLVKLEESNKELVLLYRTEYISIYTTIDELLNNTETLKISRKEIKNRVKYFKKTKIEHDIGPFYFSDGARALAYELLYKNKCLIKIDNQRTIKQYSLSSYQTKDCYYKQRFKFEDNIYVTLFLEQILIF